MKTTQRHFRGRATGATPNESRSARKSMYFILALCAFLPVSATAQNKTVWLDELNVKLSTCGWQQTQKNKSVGGNKLKLGSKTYERGIGTHAPGEFHILLDGKSKRFTALVGIDDESGTKGTAEFKVMNGKKLLWKSGVMKGGATPKKVDIDLTDVKKLKLVVTVGGDNYGNDHADWVSAKIAYTGKKPRAVKAKGSTTIEFADVSGTAAIVEATDEVLTKDWQTQQTQSRSRSYRFPPDQALNKESLLLPEDSKTPTEVATRRLEALLKKLKALPNAPDLDAIETRLAELKQKNAGYIEIRKLGRQAMLANPLVNFDSILFVSRGVLNDHQRRKREYDGDHFCDQYFGHNARKGGGLFILKNWKSGNPEVIDVVKGLKVPSGTNAGQLMSDGAFLSPDLSYDGKTILFAWSCGGTEKWSPMNRFSIFKINVDGAALTRLTDSRFDDFDPCWLPNGRIIFMSSRRHGYGRCHGRPVPAYTMFSMKADGSDLYCIDYHETNEFHPSVDNQGMLVYTRWDYVDRDHSAAHHMWHCNPDGRDPRSYHGNYALPLTTVEGGKWPRGLNMRPWAEFNCRGIPGSHKYIATAGPHHGQAFGSLILIDTKIVDDNKMSQVKRITPNTVFPEAEGGTRSWEQMAWGTAWPLSEDFYMCNYKDTICILDSMGNRELVCKTRNGLRPIDPIPLRPRKRPPIVPCGTYQGERAAADAPKATIGIMNVYITDEFGTLPKGVEIKQLRVVQVLPKSTPRANNPRIGFGNQSLARIPLGVAPVEKDGSVYFQAPVGKAIYFQVLDDNGMAVQSMRSVTYVHPGEQMTCLGCHESKQQAPQLKAPPIAMKRAPSPLLPEIPDQVMFHYNRNVKPILDKKCASCHRTKDKAGPKEMAYKKLEPYLFYCGHGYLNPKHGGSRFKPGKFGARFARMGKAILNEKHQKFLKEGKFNKQDVRTIAMWLDMNSNEFSAYKNIDAQRRGEIVWPEFDVVRENITGVEKR